MAMSVVKVAVRYVGVVAYRYSKTLSTTITSLRGAAVMQSCRQLVRQRKTYCLETAFTSEIPFVFEQLTNLPLPNGTCSFNAPISKVFTTAWTSMAATGSPDGGAGILVSKALAALLTSNQCDFAPWQ
jgi:hypothetical protein